MIRKNGWGIIISCLIVSDLFRDAYRTTLGRLQFHMHLRWPWRMRLRFRSISFREHRAPDSMLAFQKHFLQGALSSRHCPAHSSPVSAALTECVLPVIILPLYVNRINNYLNTQLQISWRVSVVGKINPRRFAIREFWVKYLLTSIMILAKLLTFHYWDDSVSPWFFPTKILGAGCILEFWIFQNFYKGNMLYILCRSTQTQHDQGSTLKAIILLFM